MNGSQPQDNLGSRIPVLSDLFSALKVILPERPPSLRVVTGICYFIVFVLIVLLFVDPKQSRAFETEYLFSIAALLVIAIAILILSRRSGGRSGRKRGIGSLPSAPVQLRIVGELTEGECVGLKGVLELARTAVIEHLRSRGCDVNDSHVRGNFFMAERLKRNGSAMRLGMVPLCRINIAGEECNLKFKPGQGASGFSYAQNQPQAVLRDPSEETGWDRKWKITRGQAKLIHPELQWIISTPIRFRTSVLGVMNIDGLYLKPDVGILEECKAMTAAMARLSADIIMKGPGE